MKRIFYIVPVYKVEKYLKRCVDSILAQTYKNIEIILIDDGSPDGCPEICDELAQLHSNIKVIHKSNGGLSDARNAGIMYVLEVAENEDYLSFVDSDDFIHPEYTKTMVDLCEENGCNLAQCGYEKGSDEFFNEAKISEKPMCIKAEEALIGYRLKSMACAKLFKVKLFNDILFPVGVINEDEFTTYKAVYKAEKIVITDEKLYYYFQHGSGIMSDVAKHLKDNAHKFDFLKAYEERIMFFQENNMPEQVLKTHEKICVDMFLRYCEQMQLKKKDRDIDCVNGTYMEIYRKNLRIMIKRKGIPVPRKIIYLLFSFCPGIGVILAKLFNYRR